MTTATATADGGTVPGGRVGNVDVLRAAAAFMVLATHAYFLGGRVVILAADRWYDVFVTTGPAGVWLFFAISGYVIAKPFIDRLVAGEPPPDLPSYALRRVVRIFPLYWVALTAFIVIAGAGTIRAWHYPLHYLLLQNVVPGREQAILTVAWTLSVEVLFYMAVPLLALAIGRRRQRVTAEWLAAAVLASWAASFAFSVASVLLSSGTNEAWGQILIPSVWQMFCPGLLVALAPHLTSPGWRRWLVDLPGRRGAAGVAAAILVTAAVVSAFAPQRFGADTFLVINDTMRVAFAAGFGLVLAIAVRARPVRARIPLRLGLVSYGIYLLHPVAIALLERYWVPLPRDGLGPFAVHLALVVGLTVPLALLSWRFFEEPLIRWARSVRPGARKPVGQASPV